MAGSARSLAWPAVAAVSHVGVSMPAWACVYQSPVDTIADRKSMIWRIQWPLGSISEHRPTAAATRLWDGDPIDIDLPGHEVVTAGGPYHAQFNATGFRAAFCELIK